MNLHVLKFQNQHDMVESIEEHVERSSQAVQSGQQQLKKAVTTKNAKYPLVLHTFSKTKTSSSYCSWQQHLEASLLEAL